MYYGKYSNVLKVETKLSPPAIHVFSNRKGQAAVSWNKVSKASGIEISYRKGNGAYKVLSSNLLNRKNKVYLCELAEGAPYTFRMRAYRLKNGKKGYSDYSGKTVVISQQGSVFRICQGYESFV
ncbi:MAG: fibronectin type III domain-containing protein [Eubacterium sp.]|jgi:hypothetical protein|nr:fibronectin type III domain-containing protein [Eubacterium sp.]